MRDPAYVVAFKKMIKDGADHSHIDDMVAELFGESDRATIILSAGFAEQTLVEAIKCRMREHSVTTSLFDPDGPIGTLSAKISVAFALELFGSRTRSDLELIRMLRNGAAHSEVPIRFETPQVRAVCDHFQLPDTAYAKVPPDWSEMDPTSAADRTNPKTRFVTTCQTVAMYLTGLVVRQPSLPTLP